jgi:hypothetical protein
MGENSWFNKLLMGYRFILSGNQNLCSCGDLPFLEVRETNGKFQRYMKDLLNSLKCLTILKNMGWIILIELHGRACARGDIAIHVHSDGLKNLIF